ncbi:DNA primase [Cryptosporangium sp. NPDC051539]|uniref:DNA primase n=1 Tax=Cryptosporangium sp. NPDC051539 TaxID=3363962 RepID=UPI0037A2DB5E
MAGRHPEDVETSGDEILDEDVVNDEAEEAEESDDVEESDGERSEKVARYWEALGIDPVEIALPRGGVGLTLREYRVVEEDPDTVDPDVVDDEELEAEALAAEPEDEEAARAAAAVDDDDNDEDSPRASADDDLDEDDDDRPGRTASDKAAGRRFTPLGDDDADELDDPAAFDDDEDEDEDEEAPAGRARVAAGEEEAVFLATDNTLHLFRDADSLVAFVKSPAAHDLTTSENWAELVETLTADLVVPDDEDRYELDLVVENLRGGRDVWESDLIIGAGEIARDLAYALELTEVESMLSSGSPLDELDEAIRAKGFFGRRKLRKIGPEQAALGWRSVIGRISSAVEWHD